MAAGTVIRRFVATLGLETRAQDFAEAQIALKGLSVGLQALGKIAKAATVGVVEMVRDVARVGDEAVKSGEQIGVATERFQQFAFAAELAMVPMGQARRGFQQLQQKAFFAAQGMKEGLDGFNAIGVAFKDSSGQLRSAEDLMFDLADRFSEMEDGTLKTAIANRLMGETGAQMIPMLNQGSKALRRQMQELKEYNSIIGTPMAKRMEVLNDSMFRLGKVFLGIRVQLASKVIPVFNLIVGNVLKWVRANRALIKTKLQRWSEMIADVFLALWKVTKAVLKVFGFFGRILDLLIDKWKATAFVLGLVTLGMALAGKGAVGLKVGMLKAAAASALAWTIANLPLVALIAIIGVVLLLLEDIWVALNGGTSLIGFLGDKWTKFLEKFTAFDPADSKFVQGLKGILRFITVDLDVAFSMMADTVVEVFQKVFDFIGGGLRKTRDTLLEIASLGFADTETFNKEAGPALKAVRRGVVLDPQGNPLPNPAFGTGASPETTLSSNLPAGLVRPEFAAVSGRGNGNFTSNITINQLPGEPSEELARRVVEAELRHAQEVNGTGQ